MQKSIVLREISPETKTVSYSGDNIKAGIPIPKSKRIQLFSPSEWEDFTEEVASSLESIYHKVKRFSGPGDMGLDVVGFVNTDNFADGWDNYQCKHYNSPLTPSDIWVEIGKIIYHSFNEEFPPPKKYYFIGSKDIGRTLSHLLSSPNKLKIECIKNWDRHCAKKISSRFTVNLSGDILNYFNDFDFEIFSSKSLVELIKIHENTTFHAVRFGGGLPPRPTPETPPTKIKTTESRYIEQIFEAYSEFTGKNINKISKLANVQELKADFLRQRERFYHAESLRNFVRDRVPAGTFEELQDEVYHGVVDTCESKHDNGFTRLRSTLTSASQVVISNNSLSSVTKVQDKQGICHQLANVDSLVWVRKRNEKKE